MLWILIVEELRSLSHLNETSLAHCLLDNDIEDLTHGLTVLVTSVVDVSRIDNELTLLLDYESHFATTELGFETILLFIKSLSGPNIESRIQEFADQQLDSFLFARDNFRHLVYGVSVDIVLVCICQFFINA